MKRPSFVTSLFLLVALPAQRSLLDTLPQDAEAHLFTGFGVGFEAFDLPGQGTPRGLAAVGKVVWLLRGDELLRLTWPSVQVEYRVEAPAGLHGLCSDGRLLYALGVAEVVVLDPVAGRPVRNLPIEVATAITWHRGALHVAAAKEVLRLGADGMKVEERWPVSPVPVQWLASDGTCLWAASRAGIQPIGRRDAATNSWPGGRWPLRFAASVGTWIDGRLLLYAEYTDIKQRQQEVVGLWAPVVEPEVDVVSVKVFRKATGQRWEVGPKSHETLAAMQEDLRRIAADPSSSVKQPDGGTRRLPVVLEANPGVPVRVLAETWDAVVAAGFTEVTSPAQEAWARDRLAWARKGLQQRPK